MNPLTPMQKTGKLGELLLQLKLLEHDVQAVIPILDSGNDLIGVKGEVFRAIQVRTESPDTESWNDPLLERRFDILALVKLDNDIARSKIYLFSREEVDRNRTIARLRHLLTEANLL